MADSGKIRFGPWGLYVVGRELNRLLWAVATVSNSIHLATFLEPLRLLSEVQSVEDIGIEATYWHNTLSNINAVVSDPQKDGLRAAIMRWETLI